MNQFSDLSPLGGMRLTSLDLQHDSGGVTKLSPLKGMPLKSLKTRGNPKKDLSPLQEMPLTGLDVAENRVSDLSPLRKCSLNHLHTGPGNSIRDLRGLCLSTLTCPADVTDLSPLTQMPIVLLDLTHSKVSDLTVLKGLPLHTLVFLPRDIKTGWEADRQHPPFKTIEPNGGDWEAARPVAEFWKRFDAGEFTNASSK